MSAAPLLDVGEGWLQEQYEPATVKEIADALGWKRRRARDCVDRLEEKKRAICIDRGQPGRPSLWVAS